MSALSPTVIPPDDNRGYILHIVGWLGVTLSTIFVALRIYSRKWITRTLGWDDAIIVFSAVLNTVIVSIGSTAVSYGNGRHASYLKERTSAAHSSTRLSPSQLESPPTPSQSYPLPFSLSVRWAGIDGEETFGFSTL
jgi:hypothetical protein